MFWTSGTAALLMEVCVCSIPLFEYTSMVFIKLLRRCGVSVFLLYPCLKIIMETIVGYIFRAVS